jgi:UDP-GlcNAc:undecaprenyl-phosphate/decaprenyl-phosphate GlcNAc-1-phosphate transferase
LIPEFGNGVMAAILASLLSCAALMRVGPLDRPAQAHKQHSDPTPTGGVGICFGFAAGLLMLSLSSDRWRQSIDLDDATLLSPAAVFAFLFLLIGFIDDARPLGPRLKFALFAAASLGAALQVGVVNNLPLGWHASLELPFLVGLAGTALWVFALVNCVNFMDGANGLAMGCVAIGLFALAMISYALGSTSGTAIGLCGAGALFGFLFWNFPNGRLFAGDAGALFAGALAALGSLIVIARTELSPFIPPLLFFPLLADALLTLAWRVGRRRRSLLDGHSEHLYQIALRARWSHPRVAYTYWTASAICGGLGYLVARDPASPGPWLALAAAAAISLLVSALVRGYAIAKGIAEV